VSAQLMGGKDYDPIRTLRSIVIGGVSAIPSFKWWVCSSKLHPLGAGCRALTFCVLDSTGSSGCRKASTSRRGSCHSLPVSW